MKTFRILVGSYGDHRIFKKVNYRIEDLSVQSKIALSAIYKKYFEDYPYRKVIVVVSDTTIPPNSDYRSHLEEIRRSEEEFLREQSIDDFDLVISPGTGTFEYRDIGRMFTFEGSMSDVYYDVLYKIAKILRNPLEEYEGGGVEIYLDVSAGWNVFPVAIQKALREIANMLSFGFNVSFKVLCSEPFYEENATLNVHTLSEETVLPDRGGISDFKSKYLLNIYLKSEARELAKRYPKNVGVYFQEEIRAFLGAAKTAGILALYRFYPDPNYIEKILDEWHRTYIDGIRTFEDRLVRAYMYNKSFESFSKTLVLVTALSHLGVKRSEKVDIDELMEVGERVLRSDRTLFYIFKNEVSNIKNRMNSKSFSDEVLLGELMGVERTFKSVRKSIDQRVFVAHAGLPMDVVYVDTRDRTLRYDESRIEEVMNVLKNIHSYE